MASGTRGYNSYRGRGRKGKVFLAIVLILIILASIGFIIARENMTYDADGTLHVQWPWSKGAEAPDRTPEAPEMEIEEPEVSDENTGGVGPMQAVQLGTDPAQWQVQLDAGDVQAFAVTMKDAGGTLYYPFENAAAGRKLSPQAEAAQAALPGILDGSRYAVARLSCLRDGGVARENLTAMGLENTGGYVFYDGNNENWLDPSKEAVRSYLSALAVECADLGFDEILLTDLTYPTEGKLDKIAYGADESAGNPAAYRAEQIAGLLEAVQTALAGRNVNVSLEVPEAVYENNGVDENAGINLQSLPDGSVSRIYVPTTPEKAADMAGEESGTLIPELAVLPADGMLKSYLILNS